MSAPLASLDAADFPDAESFRQQVMAAGRPVVLRGAAAHWPLVAAGRSAATLSACLRSHDAGRAAEMFVGPPAIAGRYHYGEGADGFNFTRETLPYRAAIDRILATAGADGQPTLYVGSLSIDQYLPGLVADHGLAVVPAGVSPRIWLGHATAVACHYDLFDNVACVVAGRRRFTLYPPAAIGDLYVGPIDHTLAGQPISLADGSAPGDPRYPRFERVRDQAITVELAAGDALYLPKLWWHRVEALDPYNLLVNFWWDGFASGSDQPQAAMLLAMIALSERPAPERESWRAWFDHYVFRPDGHPLAHLPAERHGLLGPLKPVNYGRIRALVMRLLRG
ncbi:cupin-like domain-containing protein [Sphingomonas abaci]|uniref:JmjC domain-containing protein n=1 Tax=Sphingomonas abaci TaxID=237611 RepID=A0A7W7AJJ6_9SPHN|nr:cupin-like domain-containing protein [Sphingomonas abaci]MBB4618202.1 hypothetical protein [Sphingomonas abaci]